METLNSVPGSSDKHAQFLTADNSKIIWNLNKFWCALCVLISAIVHKNNITQADNHQFRVNYFKAAHMIETFNTCPFLLSLQRFIKKNLQNTKYHIVTTFKQKQLNSDCMYSWKLIHVWLFLFHSLLDVNYKSVKWKPFSVDWLRGQNFKTLWVQVPWWNGNQTCIGCNFLYLSIIFFLLKFLDFLWNHFVTQKFMTNILLPTHPPKTSDWRFAWQKRYWRRPLT